MRLHLLRQRHIRLVVRLGCILHLDDANLTLGNLVDEVPAQEALYSSLHSSH